MEKKSSHHLIAIIGTPHDRRGQDPASAIAMDNNDDLPPGDSSWWWMANKGEINRD